MFSSRIMLYFLFVLVSTSFISESKAQPYKLAPNCARLECPSYTVIYTNKDFEIRSYKVAEWVSSPKIVAETYTLGSNKGFITLFNYYNGNNQPHLKINMTTPVLVDIQNSAYTVYFYVPQKYQKSIPQPLTNEIKPVMFPQHKYVAVRRFDGYLSDLENPKELAALKKSLQGTPYKRAAACESYTVAGYNSPFELLNRVNEVMLWFY